MKNAIRMSFGFGTRLCVLLTLAFTFTAGVVQAQSSYTDLHDFGGTVINANGTTGPDGQQPEKPVVFDSAGNMYGLAVAGAAIVRAKSGVVMGTCAVTVN